MTDAWFEGEFNRSSTLLVVNVLGLFVALIALLASSFIPSNLFALRIIAMVAIFVWVGGQLTVVGESRIFRRWRIARLERVDRGHEHKQEAPLALELTRDGGVYALEIKETELRNVLTSPCLVIGSGLNNVARWIYLR